MAWTKAKTAVVIGISILSFGTVVDKCFTHLNSILSQRLEDGSTLVLNGVSFGDQHKFGFLGKRKSYHWPGHDELFLEFRLNSKDGENHPLVKPAFYRQFRCVLRGEHGIEYVEELQPDKFAAHSDKLTDFVRTRSRGLIQTGYFGYMQTSILPRDSRWLWVRLEKRDDHDRYDAWQKVAEFKFKNPASSTHQQWTAQPTPATNTVDGMNFVLGEISVQTFASMTNDIWNHKVTVPTGVWKNGVLLTNWAPTYTRAADASGNSSYFQSHRSLDPRYVWKLDMDFEPESDFPSETMATVALPEPSTTLTTNVMNVPVTIAWDGYWIDASIPTNHVNVALKYVGVANDQGDNFHSGGGSWGKYNFRKGSFMIRKDHMLTEGAKPEKVTFAIVPNVHTTFYVQPKVVAEQVK